MKIKKLIAAALLCSLLAAGAGCGGKKEWKIPTYESGEFLISGFWAPYEMTEEAFNLYKDSGLNVMTLNGFSLSVDSDGQFYLGSNRTMRGLELCRKTGLKAVVNYNDWMAEFCGEPYGAAPFTSRDYYGAYKDLIVGVEISDEPDVARMEKYGADELIADYKQAYSADYRVNLYPTYAQSEQLGVRTYAEYLEKYEELFLKKFPENPFISVDFYPFRAGGVFHTGWPACYEKVAELAKRYSAKEHFYIQAAEGNEFKSGLSEADLRLQVYVALCFGGSQFTYYCYENPKSGNDCLYEYCMLDQNGRPSVLYDYVKKINREIQSFAPAFLSYTRKKTFGISDFVNGYGNPAIRMMIEQADFSDRRYLSAVETAGDCLVGCFEGEAGEAYLLVNYGDPESTDEISLSLRLKGGAAAIGVYGGEDFSVDPVIIEGQKGVCKLTLKAGEGKFIVPLI